MTAESRSTLVKVWPRYGTSTRSESVAGAGDVVVVVVLMVEEVDTSRAVSVEGGGEEVVALEEAEGRLLPALGRIAGDLLRPIKAMEVITTIVVKWTDRGVTNVRRGRMVVMDGNIMVIIVMAIIVVIRLKTNEDAGVEVDPTSVMSEIEIEIGDGREAVAHMTMSVDEEGAEVEVEVETENESTITKTSRRRGITIQGEMMTIAVAIGMNERARRKGVIAAEADPEVEIVRKSHQGSIAAGAEAKAAREVRDISITTFKPGVALLLINTIQLGNGTLNDCFFLSTSHSLRIALSTLVKLLQCQFPSS